MGSYRSCHFLDVVKCRCVHFYAICFVFAGPDSGCANRVRYTAAASEIGQLSNCRHLQRLWRRKGETSLLSRCGQRAGQLPIGHLVDYNTSSLVGLSWGWGVCVRKWYPSTIPGRMGAKGELLRRHPHPQKPKVGLDIPLSGSHVKGPQAPCVPTSSSS